MKPLSERLSSCKIENAKPLLEELHPLAQGRLENPGATPNRVHQARAEFAKQYRYFLNGGPEGYLSAVAMLVPEGWYYMAGCRDSYSPRAHINNGKGSSRNPGSIWHEYTHEHPALALASAIAATLETE